LIRELVRKMMLSSSGWEASDGFSDRAKKRVMLKKRMLRARLARRGRGVSCGRVRRATRMVRKREKARGRKNVRIMGQKGLMLAISS
jgi:hypothetical protein